MSTLTPARPIQDRAGQPVPHSGARALVQEVGVLTARALRLARRDVDAMLTAVVLPVVILLLFTYVFGGALEVGTDYVTYATPGIILLCAGFGAANTALAVHHDMTEGMVERLRTMPVHAAAVLAGHVFASLAKNLVTTTVVFGVAVAIGFRPTASPLEWLAAIGVLLLFVHAITWAAVFIGTIVRSPDAASGFIFFVMFLPYVSSAFVPVETLPSWLAGFAEHQPVTPVIETVRGLLVGGTPGAPTGSDLTSSALTAVLWCVVLAAGFAVAAIVTFRRRTAR